MQQMANSYKMMRPMLLKSVIREKKISVQYPLLTFCLWLSNSVVKPV